MKEILSLLMLMLLLFTSCIRPDENDSEPEIIDMTDTYKFYDIRYSLEEGDGLEIIEYEHDVKIGENPTDQDVVVPFKPFEGRTEQSVFYGVESAEYEIDKDFPAMVNIPCLSEYDEGVVYVRDPRCDLFKETNFPSSVSEWVTNITLYSHCGASWQYNEIIHKMRVTYVATFLGEKHERMIEIKGKWEGTINMGYYKSNHIIYGLY